MKKIIILLVIAGAGYLGYNEFIAKDGEKIDITKAIGGSDSAQATAEQLKADFISNTSRDKIHDALADYVFNNTQVGQLMTTGFEKEGINKDQAIAELKKAVDIRVEYNDIKATSSGDKAILNIANPRLEIASKDERAMAFELTGTNMQFTQVGDDANHTIIKLPTDLTILGDEALLDMAMGGRAGAPKGNKVKLFTIASSDNLIETKLNQQGQVIAQNTAFNDVELVEGRGNTSLAKIKSWVDNREFSYEGDQMKATRKSEISNIEPGDMVKLMLGNIKPVSIISNGSYEGDNIENLFTQMIEAKETGSEFPKFDGKGILDEVSIATAGSKLAFSGDVNFSKTAKHGAPSGVIDVNFSDYQNFVNYLNTTFPMVPAEEVNKVFNGLKELGGSGSDINMVIDFTDINNVTINGKNQQELQAIMAKYR